MKTRKDQLRKKRAVHSPYSGIKLKQLDNHPPLSPSHPCNHDPCRAYNIIQFGSKEYDNLWGVHMRHENHLICRTHIFSVSHRNTCLFYFTVFTKEHIENIYSLVLLLLCLGSLYYGLVSFISVCRILTHRVLSQFCLVLLMYTLRKRTIFSLNFLNYH